MSSDDYELTLPDYIAILRRRALLIVSSFLAIFAISAAVALFIPPVYESTGTIMIESQQIPTDMVQATITSYADERIEVIKQRVMTRENLLRIINKFRLFQTEGASLTPSEQIDEMRNNTEVELITANPRVGQRGTGTIAFKVSFSHRRAETAQGVANELVTLFLDENVKVRTERATQTTEFLKQESQRLRTDLDKLETQIAGYKQEHGKGLPENMALSMAAMQRVETDLRQIERDYRSAEEELRYLEVERTGALAAVTSVVQGGPAGNGAAAELQRARAELAKLQGTYTDSHPDVRSLKRKIDNLEQAVAAEKPPAAAGGSADSVKDLTVSKLDTRITGVRSRMNVMSGQQSALRVRLAQMEGQLVNAPQVERGLAALMRDYQSAQRKYEEIRTKQGTAQVAENLEGEQKAERFALLEPPTIPDKPIKPDRRKLLGLGLVLATGGSAALTMLMETLHGTIRGIGAVSAILGQRPLVTVPYISVASEAGRRRRTYLALLAAALVALALAVVAVHFLYMPLDLLGPKIVMRFG
jgi:succinoglycan biosynthesis transport protein ExoP